MWGNFEHEVMGDDFVKSERRFANASWPVQPMPPRPLPAMGWQCDSCIHSTGHSCGLGLSQEKQQLSGKPCQYFARY